MPFPLRLVAVPASVALTAALVSLQVAPSDGGVQAAPPTSPMVATAGRAAVEPGAADRCSAAPLKTMAAERQRGMAAGMLRGTGFATKLGGIGSRAVVLDAGTYTMKDFLAGRDRIDSGRLGARSAGVVGAGSDRTTIALQPDTSTRASVVPGTEYEINPLNVLRISSRHPVVGGFTLQGSEQGHTYNGLRLERGSGARVADVKVVGIPGDMDRPPGETFGINDFKSTGALYEHVEVDGAGVGAAGFAANKSQGITLCDVWSHDNAISMGFAFWAVKDIALVDCVATDNGFTGFNFERVGGDVTLIRPRAEHNRWDMRVVSDVGSAKYRIVDPDLEHTQVPGKWTVEVPSTYWKHPSLQKRSDITLIVHGKQRDDLLRFVEPY